MADLAIKSKRVVTPDGIKEAFVLLKDGIIDDVVAVFSEPYPAVVDVGDHIVMPGVVDTHVHINEPGRTAWEGFETATKAALAGGITMLVDMPLNSSPVTTTVKAFEEKLSAAQKNLHTNCGFWGGIVPGNENEIEGLINKGVLGFKAFLAHSGIDDFPNVTESDLRKAMPLIARHRLPLLVHCELVSDHLPSAIHHPSSVQSYQAYLSSRPKEWEDNAIALMIRLCKEYNCPTHIVHLSSANSIEPVRKAKGKGLPLTVETAQHYLYFTAEEIGDGQTQFKCAPPIREKGNNDLLWKALEQGIIDFVATDHSPAPPQLKQLQTGDFTKAWGGISSLQFALHILWTAARQRGFNITDVVRWLCEGPARLAGMQSVKGKIAKGYDADLIVFNAEKSFEVTEEIIHHKHKVTPYLHHQLLGVVEQTYLSGVKVFDNGTFVQLNKGNLILRDYTK